MCQSVCFHGSVCNPSQVYKTLLLWNSQWPVSQKTEKKKWLTSGEWGCPLHNDPKLDCGTAK